MARMSQRLQGGITLVEVLVALLVMGVGIMGFAALQLRALETTSVTYSRTQAMAIARDIIERINTNSTGWPESYADIAGNWVAPISEASNPCILFGAGPPNSCTSQQMAAADINDVRRAANDMLFGGTVLVQQNCRGAGIAVACAIVAWGGADVEQCDPESVSIENSVDGDGSETSGNVNDSANCVIVEFWPQRTLIANAGN